ncbi:peptide MFS transporter [Lapillicoccus sp.]|uniref:peptide MFS transporter n=1 Tax=Lapillicoccus sp. TaxID=1909287 RepID=UPI0027C68EC7|nr:peptide MFS transporter [Candidatus Dormibacteraeota bacterium]
MTDVAGDRQKQDGDTSFFGQPRVLSNLFGVELWERFSFYGMQGILLIYLYYSADKGGLGIDQATATGIVGAYGGLVYLSTIAGAWLADRLIGAERTLFYAAALVMSGHIALSILPGLVGVGVGLVLIAVGSGGVKANATSLVGTLYSEKDSRRDAGFSIFYMGINIGALIGPLLTGLLQSNLGFHWGFALAAVGMAVGLIQYSVGRKRLAEVANEIPHPLPSSERTRYIAGVVVAAVVILVLALTGVLRADRLATIVIGVTIVATVIYFAIILTSKLVTEVERKRVIAFIPMFLVSAVFWSLYQQQFTVLTIYSDKQLDRSIFGWEMPVPWVQSINPVFIIVLSGVFAAIWTKMGDRQPPTPYKFAAGTVVMGIAFLLFIPMASTEANSAPLLGVIGVIFVFTIAELLLSPVGLSLATKLAPQKFHTQMVALFFLSVALGTAMAGRLAEGYTVENQVPYFAILGGIAIVVGVVLALVTPWLRRLMGGVR